MSGKALLGWRCWDETAPMIGSAHVPITLLGAVGAFVAALRQSLAWCTDDHFSTLGNRNQKAAPALYNQRREEDHGDEQHVEPICH